MIDEREGSLDMGTGLPIRRVAGLPRPPQSFRQDRYEEDEEEHEAKFKGPIPPIRRDADELFDELHG